MKQGPVIMSNEEYHKEPGLSRSGMVRYALSPAHFKTPTEQTPTMKFGSDFHTAVLEPHKFIRESLQTKDLEVLDGMVTAVKANETAMALLNPDDGSAEESWFWEHPKWGFQCKARTDFRNHRLNAIIDLKSTTDASPQGFGRAIATYRYHWHRWYSDGVSTCLSVLYDKVVFIAVEKKPPWAIGIYVADDEMMYLAKEEISRICEGYSESLSSDQWPGYEDRVRVATLPRWYVKGASI